MKPHLRILHLEDDSADAALIRMLLEREGFTLALTQVANRRDYDAALSNAYDLILSDYTIPGFDGLAALRMALDRCPTVPFIFLSGSIGEDLAIEAVKSGATDYVLKDRLTRLGPSILRARQDVENREARSEAELEARAAQERINLLLATLPVVLYTASGHGVFHLTWVGQNAEAITGYSSEHILRQRDFWRSRIHPEDVDRVLAQMASLLKRGRITVDYRWQCGDGSWRKFIDQQVVVYDDERQLRDVMGSWHDVTDLTA